MTLLETIRLIEGVALRQPAVQSIVRQDVGRLNDLPDARYGCFAWQQGAHIEGADSDIARYSFVLFYVDRLTGNRSNEEEAQSVAGEVLGGILRWINDETDIAVHEWSLHPFRYRFKDECAGGWVEVVLEVPISLACGGVYDEWYNVADFNADFNEDFQCWVARVKDKGEILIY